MFGNDTGKAPGRFKVLVLEQETGKLERISLAYSTDSEEHGLPVLLEQAKMRAEKLNKLPENMAAGRRYFVRDHYGREYLKQDGNGDGKIIYTPNEAQITSGGDYGRKTQPRKA
jgi:hypothetical protein